MNLLNNKYETPTMAILHLRDIAILKSQSNLLTLIALMKNKCKKYANKSIAVAVV